MGERLPIFVFVITLIGVIVLAVFSLKAKNLQFEIEKQIQGLDEQVRTAVKGLDETEKIDKKAVPQLERMPAQLKAQIKEIQDLSKKKKMADMPLGLSKQTVSAAFSLIILLASLFVILSKRYKAASEKWAFGSLGTILGYWLG